MYIPKTNSYISDIGTFKMLLGIPMRVNLCSEALLVGQSGTVAGRSFVILEGYMYEFIADGDSDIAEYLKERSEVVGFQARFELFCLMVGFDRHELIEEAYFKTRDDAHKILEPADTDEKKDASQNSKKTLKKLSKVGS